MIDENRAPDLIFKGMLQLNLVIVLYIAGLMAASLIGYVHEGSAQVFLQKVSIITIVPWKIPVTVLMLYIGLLFLVSVQGENNYIFYSKVVLEIFTALLICYLLNYSYTGVILLVLADVTGKLPKARWKFAIVVVILICYLLADFNLVSETLKMSSLETFLEYYRGDIRSLLLGIRNILNSINILAFIIYIILLMRVQMSEKEKILSLNEKLNQVNAELQEANRQMEEYARESIKNAETQERNRLAREIHDTLGHALTGIITGLDACVTLMDVAPEAAKEQLKVIADVARKGMTDVRRSVKALRPDALEKLELEKALVQMIEEMRKATQAQIEYECQASLKSFNKDEEEIIYRIVQEGITNAIRHGKANYIQIVITMKYQVLSVIIKDNGIGCSQVEKGFGLHHMEERLKMLHGSLSCNGEDGFRLEAKIPIRWGEEM